MYLFNSLNSSSEQRYYKIPCYMRDSVCKWCIVKNAKIKFEVTLNIFKRLCSFIAPCLKQVVYLESLKPDYHVVGFIQIKIFSRSCKMEINNFKRKKQSSRGIL